MIQVIKLSDKEQLKVYKKCKKKDLAKMLVEANKVIDNLTAKKNQEDWIHLDIPLPKSKHRKMFISNSPMTIHESTFKEFYDNAKKSEELREWRLSILDYGFPGFIYPIPKKL